jgi:hypothetical protein
MHTSTAKKTKTTKILLTSTFGIKTLLKLAGATIVPFN